MERFFPAIPAAIEKGRVVVWRMPLELSQSRLGGRTRSSNACTLISLKLAEILYRSDQHIPAPTFMHCPRELIHALTEAIIAGNEYHEKAMVGRQNENFTIPDAIKACGNNFEEVDFTSLKGKIWSILPRYLRFITNNPALKSKSRLFFLMIAYYRCILLLFERSTDSFIVFDSHMHDTFGSIICMCPASHPHCLADWISEQLFPESHEYYSKKNEELELSLLTFRGQLAPTDCVSPAPGIPRFSLFAHLRPPKRIICPETREDLAMKRTKVA